ncbi:hypothetical protein GOBAR_DD16679 [Gossypium barbadense]|nr:hypothetical protein GOBAR_DD16679 [Gossypium barbadense]
MANLNTVDVDLANLNIMDDDEDPLEVVGDDIAIDPEYGLCLVGRVLTDSIMNFPVPSRRVLTDSIMNFPSLKKSLGDLWHPLRRFYSKIDLKRVMDGMPWFFNRHLIEFHRLISGEEPSTVSLWTTIFLVQIHNLPVGFITEGMARQFRDFIRKLMEYDVSMVTRGISKFMQIRVVMDIRLPLKRKK